VQLHVFLPPAALRKNSLEQGYQMFRPPQFIRIMKQIIDPGKRTACREYRLQMNSGFPIQSIEGNSFRKTKAAMFGNTHFDTVHM
jgi:hypothetical protein